MNKVYKVIWSKVRNCYVVVSELAKRQGKSSSKIGGVGKQCLAGLLAAGFVLFGSASVFAAGTYINTEDATITTNDAVADGAIVIGSNNPEYLPKAEGPLSVAMGEATKALSTGSIAMGSATTAEGTAATAMGSGTTASGGSSTAMGERTTASGNFSTAMGADSIASANASTAMGQRTKASGSASTAMGYGTTASEHSSTAMGYETTASGIASTAMGESTTASGNNSIAAGYSTKAIGAYSFAMGTYSSANGDGSVAMGTYSSANGDGSVAMGVGSIANGQQSVAMGAGSIARGDQSIAMGTDNRAIGIGSMAIGMGTKAIGSASTSLGYLTKAKGEMSTAMGQETVAKGDNATAMGNATKALGKYSTAMGYLTRAAGEGAVAMGGEAKAKGNFSFAMGAGAKALGDYSNAMGIGTQAIGEGAMAVGGGSRAIGDYSIAMGSQNVAKGPGSVAIGAVSKATGSHAVALGEGTLSSGASSTAMGAVSRAKGDFSTAMGYGSLAKGDSSTAMGYAAQAKGIAATAMGLGSLAKGDVSVAMGNESQALASNSLAASGGIVNTDAENSVALGQGATAFLADTVALGSGSVANTAAAKTGFDPLGKDHAADTADTSFKWTATRNAIAVGDVSETATEKITRQITGLAAGSEDTDAVNVAQLKALNTKVEAGATHFYSVKSSDATKGNYYNDGATGANALAAGVGAQAKGENSIAIGYNVKAGESFTETIGAIAIGNATEAQVKDSIAIGNRVIAKTYGTVALGRDITGETMDGVLIGTGANAVSGKQAVAIGKEASVRLNSVSIGTKATAHNASVAIGNESTANQASAVAIGNQAQANQYYAVALGNLAKAENTYAVSIGNSTQATSFAGVALGNWAVADREGGVGGYDPSKGTVLDDAALAAKLNKTAEFNELSDTITTQTDAVTAAQADLDADPDNADKKTALKNAKTALSASQTALKKLLAGAWKSRLGAVSVGRNGYTRQITNVAAGTNDTDAVNVAQLKALNTKVEAGDVHYFSVNSTSTGTASNYDNKGAAGVPNSVAIGPDVTMTPGPSTSTTAGNNVYIGVGTKNQPLYGNNVLVVGSKNQFSKDDLGNPVHYSTAAIFGNNNKLENPGPVYDAYDYNPVYMLANGWNNTLKGSYTGAIGYDNIVKNGTRPSHTSHYLALAIGSANRVFGTGYYLGDQNLINSVAEIPSQNNYKDGTAGKLYVVGLQNIVGSAQDGEFVNDARVFGSDNIVYYAGFTQSNNVYGNHNRVHAEAGNAFGTSNYLGVDENGTKYHMSDNPNFGIHNPVAVGSGNHVFADYGIAVGFQNKAISDSSIAVGKSNEAKGESSSVVGYENKTSEEAQSSSAVGFRNYTTGKASVSMGVLNNKNGKDFLESGDYSSSMGYANNAAGDYSSALGGKNYAEGDYSVAVGTYNNKYDNINGGWADQASGKYSSAVGTYNTSTGERSNAFGAQNTAAGERSNAVGTKNLAAGQYSLAAGAQNAAEGKLSSTVGQSNQVVGDKAQAFGYSNFVSGYGAVAFGSENNLYFDTDYSAAGAVASGDHSAALGISNVTVGRGSAGVGNHNVTLGKKSVGLGVQNLVTGYESIALGDYVISGSIAGLDTGTPTEVDAVKRSVALGSRSTSDMSDAVALGSFAVTSRDKGDYGYDPSLGGATSDAIILKGNSELSNIGDYRTELAAAESAWQTAVEAAEDKLNAIQTQQFTTPAEYAQLTAQYNTLKADALAKETAFNAAQKKVGDLVGTWQSQLAAVSVGDETTGRTRQITGVAAGTNDTDAVNVAQLKKLSEAVTTGTTTLTNTGLKFGADSGNPVTNKLGSQVNVVGRGEGTDADYGSSNIRTKVTQDSGTGNTTIEVMLKKDLDLTEDGSVTIGDATIDKSGLTVGDTAVTETGLTIGTETSLTSDSLTIGGDTYINDTGLNANDKKITNVEDGEVSETSEDAVNGSQLYAVQQDIQDINENLGTASAWNIAGNGEDITTIAKNGQVNFVNGSNTTVTVTETADGKANVKVNLSDEITLGKTGMDGTPGVTIYGKDGVDGVDGSEGHIGLNGKDGMTDIRTTTGSAGVDGADGETATRIVYQDPKGKDHSVATLDDGLRFQGDSGQVTKKLNTTMTIKGADENIATNVNEAGEMRIQLNKNLKVDSLDAGGTTIGKDGISVPGKDGAPGVSITQDGIDAGGQTISNVKPGEKPGDVATVDQIQNLAGAAGQGLNELGGRLSRLDSRVNKVGAGAAALAALHPVDFDADDKLDVAAGWGHYRGANSMALGAFYRPDERTMFSIGGAVGNGENMINAGVTFKLDKLNNGYHNITSKVQLVKEVNQLKTDNAELRKDNAELREQVKEINAKLEQLLAAK